MTRTLYDSVTASNIPRNAQMVAGYVNGRYQNFAEMVLRFPQAVHVPISVRATFNGGTVLDVEIGDATPAEAPGWVKMRREAGVDPTVYCNSSTWPAVRLAFKAAGVREPHYWIAQYDNKAVLPAGAVAKQYADPGPYDLSIVADYWPGIDPEGDIVTPQDKQDIISGITSVLNSFRSTLQADNLWWLDHALNGVVPDGASKAQAQAITDIHAAIQKLGAKP